MRTALVRWTSPGLAAVFEEKGTFLDGALHCEGNFLCAPVSLVTPLLDLFSVEPFEIFCCTVCGRLEESHSPK